MDSLSIDGQAVRPVKLGVLLDGKIQEGWVLESLRQALAVPGVRLAAVAGACGNSCESVASLLHPLFYRLSVREGLRKERPFSPDAVTAAVPRTRVNIQ